MLPPITIDKKTTTIALVDMVVESAVTRRVYYSFVCSVHLSSSTSFIGYSNTGFPQQHWTKTRVTLLSTLINVNWHSKLLRYSNVRWDKSPTRTGFTWALFKNRNCMMYSLPNPALHCPVCLYRLPNRILTRPHDAKHPQIWGGMRRLVQFFFFFLIFVDPRGVTFFCL